MILNVHEPNNSTSKYMTQQLIELKEDMDRSTIVVVKFKTQVSATNRNTKQKISKDIEDLNKTVNKRI